MKRQVRPSEVIKAVVWREGRPSHIDKEKFLLSRKAKTSGLYGCSNQREKKGEERRGEEKKREGDSERKEEKGKQRKGGEERGGKR